MALYRRSMTTASYCRALVNSSLASRPPAVPRLDESSWAWKAEPHKPPHRSPCSASEPCDRCGRCFSSSAVAAAGERPAEAATGRVVVYKGKGQRVFRVLVRLKVAQLVGVAAAAVPIATYAAEGSVPLVQLLASGGLLVGCGVASLALWYYSSRYVGELSSLPGDRIMISTMDFWGHRADNIVHVLDVAPPLAGMSPAALQVMAERALMPLNVSGGQQYFISVRHGHLLDKAKLMSLLKGEWEQEARLRLEAQQHEKQQQMEGLGSIGGVLSKKRKE